MDLIDRLYTLSMISKMLRIVDLINTYLRRIIVEEAEVLDKFYMQYE